jgi:tetratricopeptide (TPR) repeat protein
MMHSALVPYFRRAVLFLSLFFFMINAVWASPRSDAWNLRRSNPEEALRQLQTVVQTDPRDAKAYWFITMLQKDLNRPAEALQALETAKRIDPALSFSSADSVNNIETSLRKALGQNTGQVAAPAAPNQNGTSTETTPGINYGRGSNSQVRSEAWNMRRTNPVEALRILHNVVQTDPSDAKAYWFITMLQKDLNRPAEALQALASAKRLDPSLSFSSADSVNNIETSLRRSLGGAPAGRAPHSNVLPPQASSGRPAGNAPALNEFSDRELFTALSNTGVFVAPSQRGAADAGQIAAAIKRARLKTNVIVIDRLPQGHQSAAPLTQMLHGRLGLGEDGLLVVVSDRPRSLGIYGGGLDKASLDEIALRTAKTFDSEGYAAGISRVIALVDEERARQASASRNLILMIIGVPTGLILWGVQRGKKRRAAEAAQARELAITQSNRLTPLYEKLSSDFEYALLGQTDPVRRDALLASQQRAGEAFSEAMSRLKRAHTSSDYDASRGYMKAADREMQRARNVLNGLDADAGLQPQVASGNDVNVAGALQSGPIPAGARHVWEEGEFEVPPLGANMPGAQPGYALDFFTSQPVPRDQMVPVDIDINGQQRRVWATPDSAQRALNGDPQIATVNSGGQSQAWFDTPRYNPWNDWGSQALQMIALNVLINSMMNSGRSYGYGNGYGGYDSGYGGGYGGNWNDDREATRGDGLLRDQGYDSRMDDTATSAGGASLESPFDRDWSGVNDNTSAGGASLDVFGGGGFSGGDSS